LTSCISTKKNAVGIPLFDIQGHRGCRGLMPENTLPAMIHAVDLGVTTLEMDVVITADSQVILSHEPFFNHEITTLPQGNYVEEAREKKINIYTMLYADVMKYDVGIKPHPRFLQQQKMTAIKPTLDTLFTAVENYIQAQKHAPVFYNIETKTQPTTDNIYHPAPAPFVELLMGVVNKHKLSDRVIIQSFDIRTLQYLHAHYPAVKTALLLEEADSTAFEKNLLQLGFAPTVYSPHFSLVNNNLVNLCHAKKIKLVPWTVNDTTTLAMLKKLGVDGIITDYPNFCR
jgi:glycerophosphoryl diester phosphodiesterase